MRKKELPLVQRINSSELNHQLAATQIKAQIMLPKIQIGTHQLIGGDCMNQASMETNQ